MTPDLDSTLLSARDLGYCTDGGHFLFQNLNFSLAAGEILWVRGPLGSGKSTLLRLLGGTQVASSGDVERQMEPEEIGFIPQLRNAVFHLPQTFLGILEGEAGDRESALKLESLGLLDKNDFSLSWKAASQAMRQRLLLTIALMKQPRLLILDDPFHDSDAQGQDRISLALVEFLEGDTSSSLVLVSATPLDDIASFGIPIRQISLG